MTETDMKGQHCPWIQDNHAGIAPCGVIKVLLPCGALSWFENIEINAPINTIQHNTIQLLNWIELKDQIDVGTCYIRTSVRSWPTKKNTSHGNKMLSKGPVYLIQRLCNQIRGPQQDPACHRALWRSDYSEETEAEVVRTYMSPDHPAWQRPSCKAVREATRKRRQRKRWRDNVREDRTGI